MEEEKKNQKVKDERGALEKAGDVIEDTLDSVDEVFHPGDFQNDIPATIKTDSGRRIIHKAQTNKNINKKLFGENWQKIFLVIILVMLVIGGVIALVEFLM